MTTYLAPAKINLWLRIFAPDETGYHPLDTLFCAIDLSDEITVALTGDGIQLTVTGADIGPTDKNLAHRAATEFFIATGIPPRAAIVLKKAIPAGGGLGGGSSDAATVLRALNELHGNVLPDADLMAIGARLGSDVAFFLCGSALAHATGRGELLEGVPPLPRAALLLVTPAFAVATAEAYAHLDAARAFADAQAHAYRAPRDWNDVAQRAVNDFERVLFDQQPELAQIRQAIAESGARISLLSGSGSTVFGLYDSEAARDRAGELLKSRLPHAQIRRAATQI